MSILSKTKFIVVPLLAEPFREELMCLQGVSYEFDSLATAETFCKEDADDNGYAICEVIRFVKPVTLPAKLVTIK